MAVLKPALISEDGKFIKVAEGGDKLDGSYISVEAPLKITAGNAIGIDISTIPDASAAVMAHNNAADAHSALLATKVGEVELTGAVVAHNNALGAHSALLETKASKTELTSAVAAHDARADAHTEAMALKVNVVDVNRATTGPVPGDNFNDYINPGAFAIPAGVYINQPPVTSNGIDLKEGVLRVTVGPGGDAFQEFMVWQAGGLTGVVLTRGWHKAINSWGGWIEAVLVADIAAGISAHDISPLSHMDIRDLVSGHNISLDAHAALFGTKIRNRYTNAVTLYVRPDGNDNSDGLVDSAAGALKTLAGVQAWQRRSDLSGYAVTCIMNPGTYAGAYWSGLGINCATTLKSADPSNKAVIPSALTAINYAHLTLQDLVLQNALMVDHSSIAYVGNCDFEYQGASSGTIITAQRNSYLYLQTGCSISGTASVGLFSTQLSTINNWGTLTFNNAVLGTTMVAERLGLIYTGATFSGNVTGRRFMSRHVALIDSNNRGPNAIPGTDDGIVEAATGGFYR